MYDREELLVKVATMFYENNITQTQISKDLGISRPTIASLLDEAREKKIVQIVISHPNKLVLAKEKELQNLFPETKILIATQSNGTPKEAVGVTTAILLNSLFQSISSVGIGWGTTLYEVTNAFDFVDRNHLTIFPLIGGIVSTDVKYHSNHLVSALAMKVNGKAEYLYAPAIADDIETKNRFVENKLINDSLTKARNVDLALIGIGNPIVNSNYQEHGFLSEKEIDELKQKNVIGDVLTSFFTSDGKVIDSNISNRMIGLNFYDLKKIKTIVAVAAGEEKAQSVLVALESQLTDYLIVDELLADSVLTLAAEKNIDTSN